MTQMANPTRFTRIGLSGRKGQVTTEGLALNSGDWAMQTIAFTPELADDTSDQSTGIIFPKGMAVYGFVVVNQPSDATIKTISCGTTTNPIAVVEDLDISAVGVYPINGTNPVSTGEELVYSIGSSDGSTLDVEIVFTVLGSTVEV
jgi:hypothetical protein